MLTALEDAAISAFKQFTICQKQACNCIFWNSNTTYFNKQHYFLEIPVLSAPFLSLFVPRRKKIVCTNIGGVRYGGDSGANKYGDSGDILDSFRLHKTYLTIDRLPILWII